mmetsp:Transcript_74004/g.154294  ORF Transcript_74004/g.154294 Transcript_74004/m.154294 type:complete len:213 (+) Transcript_74004:558-1196(+)
MKGQIEPPREKRESRLGLRFGLPGRLGRVGSGLPVASRARAEWVVGVIIGPAVSEDLFDGLGRLSGWPKLLTTEGREDGDLSGETSESLPEPAKPLPSRHLRTKGGEDGLGIPCECVLAADGRDCGRGGDGESDGEAGDGDKGGGGEGDVDDGKETDLSSSMDWVVDTDIDVVGVTVIPVAAEVFDTERQTLSPSSTTSSLPQGLSALILAS